MNKKITTHSNSFHCDELTAIALLHVFTDDTYTTTRIPHQDPIPDNSDFVIDIGRKHEPENGLFDHHQWEGGKSSAGLIFDHLNLASKYPKIADMINLIDQNDVGLRKAYPFELPRIIGCFNSDDIYDDKVQMIQFNKALDVLVIMFESMKSYQDKISETEGYLLEKLANLSNLESENGIVICDKFLPGWPSILNGQLTPTIRCLAWPKLDGTSEWHAQVIPIEPSKYGLHGNRFEPDESMEFVHANGFFCVAESKLTMLKYLTKE